MEILSVKTIYALAGVYMANKMLYKGLFTHNYIRKSIKDKVNIQFFKQNYYMKWLFLSKGFVIQNEFQLLINDNKQFIAPIFYINKQQRFKKQIQYQNIQRFTMVQKYDYKQDKLYNYNKSSLEKYLKNDVVSDSVQQLIFMEYQNEIVKQYNRYHKIDNQLLLTKLVYYTDQKKIKCYIQECQSQRQFIQQIDKKLNFVTNCDENTSQLQLSISADDQIEINNDCCLLSFVYIDESIQLNVFCNDHHKYFSELICNLQQQFPQMQLRYLKFSFNDYSQMIQNNQLIELIYIQNYYKIINIQKIQKDKSIYKITNLLRDKLFYDKIKEIYKQIYVNITQYLNQFKNNEYMGQETK